MVVYFPRQKEVCILVLPMSNELKLDLFTPTQLANKYDYKINMTS